MPNNRHHHRHRKSFILTHKRGLIVAYNIDRDYDLYFLTIQTAAAYCQFRTFVCNSPLLRHILILPHTTQLISHLLCESCNAIDWVFVMRNDIDDKNTFAIESMCSWSMNYGIIGKVIYFINCKHSQAVADI
jgi:hypothetical protein